MQTLNSPPTQNHARSGYRVPGVVLAAVGCVLFVAGWALLFGGVGQYLLLPGLALGAIAGWLLRGRRGALVAPALAVIGGIVLLVLTNATAATSHALRGSDAPAIQTPSPKR